MPFEKQRLPLSLSGVEVVFLADALSNKEVAEGLPDQTAYVPLSRETLLLLGSAYTELVTPSGILPGPVTLHITEDMAWLLRGKVRTGDVGIDGQTNVGVSLLLKLYPLLSAFNSDLGALNNLFEVAEEPKREEMNSRLQEFRKEIANAGTESSKDTDSNADA